MNILDIRIQKLFVITLFFKVVSSGLGWYLQSPWLLGFFTPLAIMIAYIFIGIYRRDTEVSDEKFADSAYYLGFIFTITSIIFSLFDLPNIGTRIQDISVRFGAAMVSTVLGLGVRVYLVSFRADVSDAIHNAEDALLNATQSFTERLKMTLEKLQDFESQIDLAARSSVERVNMQIEAMSKNHADKLTDFFVDLTDRNQKAFTTALEDVRGASSRLSDSVEGYASGMKSHLGSIEKRVTTFADAITTRLQTTTFPDDYFAKSLAAPLAQLESAASNISLQVSDASEEMSKALNTLLSSLKIVQKKSTQIEAGMDSVLQLSGQQQQVLNAAESQINALTQLVTRLEKSDNILIDISNELNIGHKINIDFSNRVKSMVDETIESRQEIIKSLARMSEQVSLQVESNTSLVSRMDATLAANERITIKLGDSASIQMAASSHLQASVDLASKVANKYSELIEIEKESSKALIALSGYSEKSFSKINEAADSLQKVTTFVSDISKDLSGKALDNEKNSIGINFEKYESGAIEISDLNLHDKHNDSLKDNR